MLNKSLSFFSIPLVLFLAACASEAKESKIHSAYSSLMAAKDCGNEKTHICNEGLFFVKIGDSIPTIKIEDTDVKNIKDTLVSTEDYEAYGKIISFSDGFVILEGAPLDKDGETSGSDQTHVKSIRILTPRFETPEKIKVGSTFTQLKSVYPDSLFEIQPNAAGIVELKMPQISSRVNFLIRPSRPNIEEAPGAESYDISSIPGESKIEAITLY